MPRQEKQKPKLMTLARIFERETDEHHRLAVPDLTEMLLARGVPCERKCIYSDIEALRGMGYDIMMQRGRGGGYWLAHRDFELAELKLLVDAVQSCRFIPQDETDALIRKLERLTSRFEAEQLQRQVVVAGRPRSRNKAVLYTIDALHDAIHTGRQVAFHYANGKDHIVSPWQMAWDSGAYYLIAYQDYAQPAGIRHYRVDRMSRVTVLPDSPRQGQEAFANFNLPAYLKKHFHMYGGPEYQVTLRCAAELRQTMLDRFGQETILIDDADGGFHFTAPICVSDPFLGWVCGFGGKVTITAPAEVRAQMASLFRSHCLITSHCLFFGVDLALNPEYCGGSLKDYCWHHLQSHLLPEYSAVFRKQSWIRVPGAGNKNPDSPVLHRQYRAGRMLSPGLHIPADARWQEARRH